MDLLRLFKLEKLKIQSFETPKRAGIGETFEVMFNPESYSLGYKNVYDKKQGINTSGRTSKYAMSSPTSLSMTIILDGTEVRNYNLLPFGQKGNVHQEVEEFLRLTYRMQSTMHEPRFLIISWGDLTFKCRLGSVDIKYTLFNNRGEPLRAELNTQFFRDVPEADRLKEENKNSPDLTHSRIVKGGDKLPDMCEAIYGSPLYYIQVARANNLLDFRELKPGQEIFFPPIEK